MCQRIVASSNGREVINVTLTLPVGRPNARLKIEWRDWRFWTLTMNTVSFSGEIWFTLARDRRVIGVMERTTLVKVCVRAVQKSALINRPNKSCRS